MKTTVLIGSLALVAGCAADADLGDVTQGIVDSCAETNPYDPLEGDGYVVDYDAWFSGETGCLAYDEPAPTVSYSTVSSSGMNYSYYDGSYGIGRVFENDLYGTAYHFANVMITTDPSIAEDHAVLTNRLYSVLQQYKYDLQTNRWGPTWCVDENENQVSCSGSGEPMPIARMMPHMTAAAWQGEMPVIQGEEVALPVSPSIVLPRYTAPWHGNGQISIGGGFSVGYIYSPSPANYSHYGLPYNNHGFGIRFNF
jgi:hypothetical protein